MDNIIIPGRIDGGKASEDAKPSIVVAEFVKTKGIAIARAYKPDVFDRKVAIEFELIKKGYKGWDLEEKALQLLQMQGLDRFHEAIGENTLVNGGTNAIVLLLTGGSFTPVYNNANAALGVGDSSAAFALSQTNLQGAVVTTDRIRKAMDATFPTVAANVATFRATFATTEANFIWNEWGLFNNVTDASGTMLNRSVANLGTKTSAAPWQLVATITEN